MSFGRKCLLALASLPAAVFAQQPTITWMMADTPPFHIGDGPLRDQGIRDLQRQFLQHALPQFAHRTVIASVTRNWYDMQRNDGVCIVGVVHLPERDAFASFSARGGPPLGSAELIVKKSRLEGFKDVLAADHSVDLKSLAQAGRLTGGYQSSRTYSSDVLGLIADRGRALHLEPVIGVPQLFSLLDADRLDFVLAKPIEAAYFKHANDYAVLRIRDGRAALPTYIACSKGPIGTAAIAAIDTLLRDDANWNYFVGIAEKWADNRLSAHLAE